MERFTRLYFDLDETTRTAEKLAALQRYFAEAPPEDAAWALFFLSERKLMRAVSTRLLRQWATEATGLPAWLVDECYTAVGDLSEALALLLPAGGTRSELSLGSWVRERLLPLRGLDAGGQRRLILQSWQELDSRQRLVFHKLISGSFRVGVARRLVTRALAEVAGVGPAIMAHRLSGQWDPSESAFRRLMQADGGEGDPARPYPFFLAYPLDRELFELGEPEAWQAEWKWDGIRAQLIHRGGPALVWSRGEELISAAFPEIAQLAADLPPGTVADGEVLAFEDDRPLPFTLLQRRLNRKAEQPRLFDDVPVVFMAYDLLEWGGRDIRQRPLGERRALLDTLDARGFARRHWRLSPVVPFANWDELARRHAEARERQAEGLMLKRRSAPYGVGRQRGDWWKWKVDPFHVDAVLIYAQGGHGRRASLFTDYTFGVWNGPELVPVAKAYSGLTDEEIREVDEFVRRNTTERFGGVHVVRPELVFELAFEGIQLSDRHKSGVALRFPRMARWRRDKPIRDADSLDSLKALLRGQEVPGP